MPIRRYTYLYFRLLEFVRNQPPLYQPSKLLSWCQDQVLLSALAAESTGRITPIVIQKESVS